MVFKSGDIVIVTGSTIDNSGKKELVHILAKIKECGKYDAILHKFPKSDLDRQFLVPLEKCQKININKVDLDKNLTQPKIGNLVMSVYESFGKEEKTVGHLEKIKDIPGSRKLAGIRTSIKLVTVPYETLIILEE